MLKTDRFSKQNVITLILNFTYQCCNKNNNNNKNYLNTLIPGIAISRPKSKISFLNHVKAPFIGVVVPKAQSIALVFQVAGLAWVTAGEGNDQCTPCGTSVYTYRPHTNKTPYRIRINLVQNQANIIGYP